MPLQIIYVISLTEIKAKRNHIISELMTFRIKKAKANVKSGWNIYVNMNAKDQLSQLISTRKRKQQGIRGELISL